MLLHKRPSLLFPPTPPATHCQCPHLTALVGPLSGFLSVPPGLYFARVFPRFKRSAAPLPPLLPSDTEKKKHRVPSYELHIWPVMCICSRLPKGGHRVCCDTLPLQTEGAARETREEGGRRVVLGGGGGGGGTRGRRGRMWGECLSVRSRPPRPPPLCFLQSNK